VAVPRQMLRDAFAEKQKLERDLSLAREIQQSLLPERDPQIPGFSIAGYSEPADATGGDCYDYIEMADDRLGLLIADATGHGIGPALIVSQYRAMIRALTAIEQVTMDVMCRVNDLLGHDLPAGMFVTTFFGVLHSQSATIKYLSAGHGPLLLYQRATDKAIELDADTFPLGILTPLECEPPDPVRLDVGDVFLLVTDGFFEWANAQREQYGVQRIFDVIRKHPDATAGELIKAIRQGVGEFTAGTKQADDLTAIAIKRLR
jgi:sigma-B regulation protein RsbU (phosphoserine phosphatase)